ncbi:MAG: 5-methylcytosine-specific restriction endonuclease system specificity protein McrC, partial [bacterium]|nr:5-methylcytosine-specific restriction endonuclease system specificity protein McrC [bacterium]
MSDSAGGDALVGRIPVRNVWLLMLYASRLYREIPGSRRYAVEENPDDIPDLVAEILVHAVQRRLRRNLSSELRRRQADLTRVRGRIDHLRTERRGLLQRGRVACTFDELTTDTPRNRFVKAGLRELTRTVQNEELVRRCRTAAAALERAGVGSEPSSIQYRSGTTTPDTTGRTNAEDRQMLAAARLAFRLRLPTEDPGTVHLSSPDRDDVRARTLFEAAVGGFYQTVLPPHGWKVGTGKRIHWQVEHATSGMAEILPSMQTDIVLEGPAGTERQAYQRLVIDTKFTHILSPAQYGDENKLRSGYLYQMYAYLRTQECADDPLSQKTSGLLLHPSVGQAVDEEATIQGHRIRFATVDLAADSVAIRSRLLSL